MFIDITINYDETTIANNLIGNNINIKTGNDATMISTKFYDINGVEKEYNDNNTINYQVANNLKIGEADEQHIHEHQHEEFGTSLSRAIAGGAITGLASSIGVKGGEYLGNMASTGITTNSALSASVNAGVKAATMSYSTSIGTAMSNTAIYGGDFGDVMKAGWKSAGDKDTWKSVGISAGIVGLSAAIFELTGNTKSLEKGDNSKIVYKPDKEILDDYLKINPDYNGVIDKTANNIAVANKTKDLSLVGTPITPYSNYPWELSFWKGFFNEGGAISKTANAVPGMNSMSLMHDFWTNSGILSTEVLLELSIAPAIVVQYCATSPALCGNITSNIMNNNEIDKNNDYNINNLYDFNSSLNINYGLEK